MSVDLAKRGRSYNRRNVNVDSASFNILSFCSGAGMLDVAVELALEWHGIRARTVGYAERESSAAATLLARMEESSLEPAPIWCGDLESFPSEIYRGHVAGGVAGFPCPPVSQAGQRRGVEDERWILPAILDAFCAAGCEWLFFENVRGLLSANDGAAFAEVLRLLAVRRFDVEWTMLEAAEVGAGHERARVFFLAHARGEGFSFGKQSAASFEPASEFPDASVADSALSPGPRFVQFGEYDFGEGSEVVADAAQQFAAESELETFERGCGSSEMANASGERIARGGVSESEKRIGGVDAGRPSIPVSVFAPGPRDERWGEIIAACPHLAPAIEPGVRFVADGMAVALDESRADQLRIGGNGVVALQAACAFVELLRRFRQ